MTNNLWKISFTYFFLFHFNITGLATSRELENFHQNSSTYQKFHLNYEWEATNICHDLKQGVDPLNLNRGKHNYHACSDGSVSYDQPISQGTWGWEGYCGQVAVSNVTGMFCQRMIAPKNIDLYAKDNFPGSLPGTLKTILTQIFAEQNGKKGIKGNNGYRNQKGCPKGKWKTSNTEYSNVFISNLKKLLFHTNQKNVVLRERSYFSTVEVSPVVLLLKEGNLNYHYVTVIDLLDDVNDKFGCQVVMNTWGEQKIMSCENLIKYTQDSALRFFILYFEEQK